MKLYADAGFTSADGKYATTAQIEVLPDQILSEVSETYATKDDLSAETTARTTAISQTNSAIALKANSLDVYTKTDTDGLISTEVTNRNAAIEAASNAINLSVSETYTTKTDTALNSKGINLYTVAHQTNGYLAGTGTSITSPDATMKEVTSDFISVAGASTVSIQT